MSVSTVIFVRLAKMYEVKYDIYANPAKPPQFQCYYPNSNTCLNHTLCYGKDRVCNGQCIPYSSLYQYQVYASDNVTLYRVPQQFNIYEPKQISGIDNGTYRDIFIVYLNRDLSDDLIDRDITEPPTKSIPLTAGQEVQLEFLQNELMYITLLPYYYSSRKPLMRMDVLVQTVVQHHVQQQPIHLLSKSYHRYFQLY
ncbi:unnamed protein product [Didymodactylos carnosus]|uniref:Uncharacterized protein n=1 Tax=Didymodactylos carnosus TaxID=1234261 RepID=A0A8S2EZA9_9BILA|nr:unnamed protein product [Didymodactylos carnosus]CAF4104120.1 unnamed protein product [Didymodactylos carnosus]